ncbi:YaiO family outer membrane beta-barrel protein [Massilia arenosa]|uniref:YaiO family outer membrane beta-barrel protein n=2 Tax=Zemynaea arenosa TaxID=2561931 RepID=A0A4Y9ST94_9BURK|nr:YaiO family outer membrane beta-barrel protein [Massilia arenosa]
MFFLLSAQAEPPTPPAMSAPAATYDQQYQRARELARAGDIPGAIDIYSQLLAASPRNADARLGRGLAYARLEAWALAEADLLGATEAAPNYADAWSALADMYRWSGRPTMAIAAYDRLAELRPNGPDVYLTRARAQMQVGLPARARADLDKARTLGADKARLDAIESELAATQSTTTGSPAAGGQGAATTTAVGSGQGSAPGVPAAGGLTASNAATSSTAAPSAAPVRADVQPVPVAPSPAPGSLSAIRSGAQEALASDGYRWAATLGASVTDTDRFDEKWNDQTASVRHYWDGGSLAFEALRAHRFGRADHAWALDAYTQLWPRSYANIRYQRGPTADLFPHTSWRAEVWQGFGNGWEASLSEDQLNFASTVKIHGVSIARYIGNFYLLLRHTQIHTATSTGSGNRLLARYYDQGDADNYFELAVNSGRSDDALSLVGGQTHSGGASAAIVRYLTRDWGVKAGLSYSRATGEGHERSLSAALTRRW